MAKTIKFNLVCDGHQVRTLEDLRNHFSIEDVLQYFRDKVLEKWLCVREYNEELEAVLKIKATSPYDIIKELVSIFNVESDIDKIEYSASIITYRESRILADQKRNEKLAKSNELYSDYFKRYEDLTNEIIQNPTDKSKIQTIISEIENQYAWIFKSDYRNFFYKVKDISPLAVLCLLMNQFTRKFYIFDEEIPSDDSMLYNRDVKEMYDILDGYFSNVKNLEILDFIIKKSDYTKGYEVKMSQGECMIIFMQTNCMISENKNNAELLSYKEMNYKYKILNSLIYRSDSECTNSLFYIEK